MNARASGQGHRMRRFWLPAAAGIVVGVGLACWFLPAVPMRPAPRAAGDRDDEPDPEEVGSWLAEAEAAWEGGRLAEARAAYVRIVDEAPDAPVAPYALYKLAGCDRKAGDAAAAVHDLELLLQWVDAGLVPVPGALEEHARRDLAELRDAGP